MIWQQHALTIRKLAAWKYELAAKANCAHEIFSVVMLLAIWAVAFSIPGGM